MVAVGPVLVDDAYPDVPPCPSCGEDLDLMKLDDEIYMCMVCRDAYYTPDVVVKPGEDLEDSIEMGKRRRGRKGRGHVRQVDTPRPTPTLGRLVREKPGAVDSARDREKDS